MKEAQNPDHVSLNTLLGRLKEGRYVIPDFQREFEWEPWDINDLMRSIFLDYFIGSLLLWKGKKENFQALSCEPIYGFAGRSDPALIVLDGQQRLTAMHYAFVGPDKKLPNRANRAVFYIRVDSFMEESYDEAFRYEYFSKRLGRVLSDQQLQFAQHFFPLSVLGSGGFELAYWVKDYAEHWRNRAKVAEANGAEDQAISARYHADAALAFSDHVKGIVDQYQISFIELDEDLAIDKVCDIFTQLNSKGVRLDVFDLMNALMKPKGLQLKKMWREASPRLEFAASEKMNVYVLQTMSILRQAYCSPKYLYYLMPGQEKPIRDPDGSRRKEVLIDSVEEFGSRWVQAVDAIESAIKLLRHPQEFGAISGKYLPYVSIIPVFASLQAYLKSCPGEIRLSGNQKVRHWYWASVFLNRYSGSVESTSARDYLDVRAWIENDDSPPRTIKEFENQFRYLDLRRERNTGSAIYKAIFNLLVLGGARDWISGTVPQYDDLDDHHIVPTSWGFPNLDGNLVHTILNRTPLTADTNRNVIGDRLPNVYLPELISSSGEQTVRTVLGTHFISATAFDILLRDPFGKTDFEDFIAERQRTIMRAIEELLIKERLDLSPDLRELDKQIESIELALRNLIVQTLESDLARLPSHVRQKASDRIKSVEAKDPSMDPGRFLTMDGLLEYSDLRELQDVICSNAQWSCFQDRFGNKDLVANRFGQLAEARNGIRHSRTVSQVARKDAEVAALWFNQALAK